MLPWTGKDDVITYVANKWKEEETQGVDGLPQSHHVSFEDY